MKGKIMLKNVRVGLALIFWLCITFLFLDFTGTARHWFGWMAKIQFLPAVLALNIAVVIVLIALTLIFGRIYCSIICPLGVMQDFFGWLGRRGKKNRNRYSYSPALNIVRYATLAIFIFLIVIGMIWIAALIAPYSTYGRIITNLISPIYVWGNNLFADIAQNMDSYAFYHTKTAGHNIYTLIVAIVSLTVLAILAWRNGRTYCNTICPVGTVLGFFSRYSWLKPVIDTSKCNSCGLCARRCKGACINPANHTIDYTRCVACMDCIGNCHQGAISYTHSKPEGKTIDSDRRKFIAGIGVMAASATLRAQEKTVDGGLAIIEEKKIPNRATRIVPPGAISLNNLSSHCTACQLCIANCPNGVLRPSSKLATFMQPESSYESGYCRPECTACSEVCPTGAIIKIDRAEKSSIQIGHAVWIKENCIPLTKGDSCGNCARHCPVGAITMVASDVSNPESVKIPVVNEARCIGCGACEYLCPSRPFSAIYVEGHQTHKII